MKPSYNVVRDEIKEDEECEEENDHDRIHN